jgi:FAD/FMN-containing dehydrogenase
VPEDRERRLDEDNGWKLTAGFEGFRETVDYQVDGCAPIFEEAGLRVGERSTYPVREGVSGEFFPALHDFPFLMRADLPLDAVSAFVDALRDMVSQASLYVDFGCGRVLLGTSIMLGTTWERCSRAAATLGGHAVIEKAPREFACENDIFGPQRSDWRLMQRIKAALDPHDIFSPGRLPGSRNVTRVRSTWR